MRIFLDANILVSVLNKEYPLFSYTARILSLADSRKFTVYISPVCLAIAFYFAKKKSGTQLAKKKIEIMSSKLSITGIGKDEVLKCLENKQVNDFENGLEYYSALSSKCETIITENLRDFYFSSIPVSSSRAFFENHLH